MLAFSDHPLQDDDRRVKLDPLGTYHLSIRCIDLLIFFKAERFLIHRLPQALEKPESQPTINGPLSERRRRSH